MAVIRKASMMRLDRSKRTEFIVSYVTNQWNELVDFLADPAAYVRSKQFLFEQDTDEEVDWILLPPVTVHMNCGGKSFFLARKTHNLLTEDDCDGLPAFLSNDADFASQENYAAAVAKPLEGWFHIEFAAFTEYAHVTYYPPVGGRVPEKPYTGPFNEPAVMLTGIDVAKKTGTLHVDIANTTVGRAKFLTHLARKPEFLLEALDLVSLPLIGADMAVPGGTLQAPGNRGTIPAGSRGLGLPSGLGPAGPARDYDKFIDITLIGGSESLKGPSTNCMQMVCHGAGQRLILDAAVAVRYNSTLLLPPRPNDPPG